MFLYSFQLKNNDILCVVKKSFGNKENNEAAELADGLLNHPESWPE
jgi:hypothetical protein